MEINVDKGVIMMGLRQILGVSVSLAVICLAGDVSAGVTSSTSQNLIHSSNQIFYGGSARLLSVYTHMTDAVRDIHLLPQPSPQDTSVRHASVCFITDAGNCVDGDYAGAGTDNPGGSSGGPGDDWELDGKERCEAEGYSCEPCEDGKKPSGTCPYSSSCHITCVNACPAENTLECTGADEQGVGESCDGLYASCCKLCTDYLYDEIKPGYVMTDSCKDCDGNMHYKLKCDVWGQGSGMGTYFDCGEYGGVSSSGTCTDEETGETYYKECKCPLNQEWNATSKECKCSTSFKYDCAGTNDVKPAEDQSCDGKYSKCECQNGFEWDAASGQCLCSGTDWCQINQDCGSLGYAQQSCSGKTLRCPFNTNYVLCVD